MKLPFTRHTLRGTSAPTSVTASRAAAIAAYDQMRSARWIRRDEAGSDLPPHKYAQSGAKDTYDAFKFCGDYDGSTTSARQRAYCGAVCYSFTIPSDARSQATSLTDVTIPVYGDRWLADGSVLDLYLSESPAPPAWGTDPDWTTGSPAPSGAESPAFPPPMQCVVRSNTGADNEATVSVTFATPLPIESSTHYLHLVLRLGDYTTVPTITKNGAEVDSAWIEGGAAVRGPDVDVGFSRDVAPDTTRVALDLSPFTNYTAAAINDRMREYVAAVPGFLDMYVLAVRDDDDDNIYSKSGGAGVSAPSDAQASIYYVSAMRRLPRYVNSYRPWEERYVHVMDTSDLVFGVCGRAKSGWENVLTTLRALLSVASVCRSAWLVPRTYSRLVLGSSLVSMLRGKPTRIVAYRLVPGQEFPVDASSEKVALTPNLHIPLLEITSDAMYAGTATSVPTYAKISSYMQCDEDGKTISHDTTAPANTQYSEISASIVPAGVVETSGEDLTEIPFPSPVALSGLVSFILIFYPLPRTSGFGISTIADSSVEIYVD